jgi:hypothetical protein
LTSDIIFLLVYFFLNCLLQVFVFGFSGLMLH